MSICRKLGAKLTSQWSTGTPSDPSYFLERPRVTLQISRSTSILRFQSLQTKLLIPQTAQNDTLNQATNFYRTHERSTDVTIFQNSLEQSCSAIIYALLYLRQSCTRRKPWEPRLQGRARNSLKPPRLAGPKTKTPLMVVGSKWSWVQNPNYYYLL